MQRGGSNSSSIEALADVTSTRAELLELFEKCVNLMALGAMADLKNSPQFHNLICQLCEKAPEAAHVLVTSILKHNPIADSRQEPVDRGSNGGKTVRRKRIPNKDLSSRPLDTTKNKTAEAVDRMEDETIIIKGTSDKEETNSDVVALENEISSETVEASSSANMTERQQSTASLLVPQTAPVTPSPNNVALDTFVKQTQVVPLSPRTEEIPRAKIPTSLGGVSSSPRWVAEGSLPETTQLIDLITEAASILHQFSKYRDGVSTSVHSRILQTLRNDNQKVVVASNLNQLSDGFMWKEMLERGSTNNLKVTILNMLGYMGAWAWYDSQVELAQKEVRTKKNELVDRKGASIHVLNKLQSMQLSSQPQGKWISGVGRVTVTTEEEAGAPQPNDGDYTITERQKQAQRKRISMQLSRGQKLSTKLVRGLGLGILFSQKIWDYTKKSGEELDVLIKGIQGDSGRMKLLRILGPQLERFVNEGLPDLRSFLDALSREGLVSQVQLQELCKLYPPDLDAIPKERLNTAVDNLLKDVSEKVLGKRKFRDVDRVVINNATELSCRSFNRLRQEEWFDSELIMAAMDISDKPFFIRYGMSVPLDEVKRTMIKPYERPLAGWARKINELRKQARGEYGEKIRLVYYCPLNHTNSHFTLLEINDEEKVIRHYDSMADQDTTDGTSQPTRVGKLVEVEFGDLKYEYIEAPTPQQDDNWSCGLRVVWNFRRLSNGLPIGEWRTKLCPVQMKMEIVQSLAACVEDNVMKKARTAPGI